LQGDENTGNSVPKMMLDIRFRHRLYLFAKEMECTAAKHGENDLRKTCFLQALFAFYIFILQ